MKRHPALEPFSRDHFAGLKLAKSLLQQREGAESDARRLWDAELKDHFQQEEHLLAPLTPASESARLHREHVEIEALIAALPEDSALLGGILEKHIRWEERELFPAIESRATPDQLDQLKRQTDAMEERRWLHSPARRKRVTQRRAPESHS